MWGGGRAWKSAVRCPELERAGSALQLLSLSVARSPSARHHTPIAPLVRSSHCHDPTTPVDASLPSSSIAGAGVGLVMSLPVRLPILSFILPTSLSFIPHRRALHFIPTL